MVHGGVAGDGDAEDAVGRDAGGLAHQAHHRAQRLFQDRVLKPLHAAGLALLDDAVDDVRAVADLTVAGGRLCGEFAAGHVHQDAGDGGRADVNGAAVDGRILLRGHVDDQQPVTLTDGGSRHLEVGVAERFGQLMHHVVAQLYRLTAALGLDGARKTLGVGHGVVERRLVQRQAELDKGIVRKVDPGGLQIGLELFKDLDLLAG